MSAARKHQRDELAAKDQRIDDVIRRAQVVVDELKAAVDEMRRILAAREQERGDA